MSRHVWPGGQTDTDLNPKETFKNTDFGFTGPVTWDVTQGGTQPTVTMENGTQIVLRYDRFSRTNGMGDTVEIRASQGSGNTAVVKSKFRTVFKVTWSIKTDGMLDRFNNLEFPRYTGTNRRTLELNHPGQRGATGFAAKQEAILSFDGHF